MSVVSKRRIFPALAFVLIVGTAFAIWGLPRFVHKTTSVKGQVTSFLLDDRGVVNGLLLSTGDQINFRPETGEIVSSQVKIGDEITATGHAGTQTSYGREFHGEQLAINGHTIIEVHRGPGPKRKHHEGPDREPRIEGPVANTESTEPQRSNSTANTQPQVSTGPSEAATSPEVIKVSGTVKTHLVNGHGDVQGLILSSGEQMRFEPKVGQLIVSAEQSGNNTLNVEGLVVRTERGVVLRPKSISIGTQTISFGQ